MNNLRKTLCKNQYETMWKNGGFYSTYLTFISSYIFILWKVFGFHKIIRMFSNTFSTTHLFGFNLFIGLFYTVSTVPNTITTKKYKIIYNNI